jgi:NADPH:quinone reductase-like Zn-dependent oxidoreductase
MSFSKAAAIPVNYLTAYALMVVMGSLKKDETILIQNAGGGVGLAAIQIAKHLGAKTIGTASPSKHDRLRNMGLGHAVDYRKSDWDKEILRLTDNKGVDLIIDPLGPSSWKKSYKLLRHCGRMGMFGASEMSSNSSLKVFGALKTLISMPWFHPLGLLDKNRGVFGLNMGHLWHEPSRVKEWGQEILNGVQEGWVNPHVDREFKFSEAALAHRYLEDRKNFGKVILVP